MEEEEGGEEEERVHTRGIEVEWGAAVAKHVQLILHRLV